MTDGVVIWRVSLGKTKGFFAVFLVMCCITPRLLAAATAELQPGYDQYSLNAYVSYLIDAKGDLSVDDALASPRWQLNVTGGVLNFGFTQAAVWVRTRVVLPDEEQQDWHLVVPYPLLEQARLFIFPEQGQAQPLEVKQQDFRARRSIIRSHNIHFPLPVTLSGPVDLVLRVQSSTSVQVPMELWSQNFLVNRQNIESLIWGLYFGVLLALIAYNSFLFLSMQDPAYLYYVFYLISIVLLMLCISGFGALYIWRSPGMTQFLLPVSTGMTSFWAILFALSFLHDNRMRAGLRKTLQFAALCSLILVLYAVSRAGQAVMLSGLLSIVTVGLIITVGLSALVNGVVIARYFVLAWAAFALGAMLYLLNVFGLIPVSQFSNHAVQVGSALEVVLLSFSLAHRIKEERQQKLNALEQKSQTEQQMKQVQTLALEQALHDAVTQRPNDALLVRRIQELIRQQGGVDAFALLLFHFPRLKEISSSLGWRLAEEVYCSVVEELNRLMADDPQNVVIETNTQSFVAVTEFGSLVALCAIDPARESLLAYADRYLSVYDKSIDVDGIFLNLDIVCGVACYPKHGDRADLLLQHALAARDFGLRTSEPLMIYSSEIEAFGRRRLMLIGGITQAIRDSELELYLQPQLQCQDMKLVGVEVLLRWNSPRFGSVSPVEFIEIAEEAGLMGMLTRYVVDHAFQLLQGLGHSGLDISISINLSIQNLVEPGFFSYLQDAAEKAGISLASVVLEVTETSMSGDMETVIDNLEQMAATGCSIALDDYGTGYSSLAYLSRLPIHELKIDRSFIAQMNRSDSDYRIVENTVKLARALQLQTVAEGVEDAATLAQVTRLGCDRVQGFYLGKPMPLSQFREWVLRKAG